MAGGKNSNIEEKAELLLTPVIEQLGPFEVVDVEYVKEGSSWYLRVYADKEGGIAIDDCELISRAIDPILDEKDLIPDAYILEVSSPGLTRALRKERDYQRNLDKPVEVHLYKPVEMGKDKVKIFIGDLKAYDEEKIMLDIGEEKPEEIEIQRSNISVIKQYVVF